ncbi:NAD(P)-dependent dehydrogenase (short-subunit alcohol dehydrogenase family) [Nakamurella sp. UYEF19]|uniref:hypothetical protein n=1 Tax=Nakamurella sp. UYEF19 TaxID=1756392 RepID=UPI003390F8FB
MASRCQGVRPDVGGQGIRVNTVSPGGTQSPGANGLARRIAESRGISEDDITVDGGTFSTI